MLSAVVIGDKTSGVILSLGGKDNFERNSMRIAQFFKNTSPLSRCFVLVGIMVLGLIVSAGVLGLLGWTDLSVEHIRLSQIVTQMLVFFVPAVLVSILFYDHPNQILCYKRIPQLGLWMLLGIGILIVALPVTSGLEWLNDKWHWGRHLADLERQLREQGALMEQTTKDMLQVNTWGEMVLNILVVALLPALCEETFFRGCLQQILDKWSGNRHLAILFTAAIFSLAHGNLFAFLPRFALGLLLGYLFLLSGSLWVNIAAHFVNNAILVVWYFLYEIQTVHLLPEEHSPILVWIYLIVALVVAFVIRALLNKKAIQKKN